MIVVVEAVVYRAHLRQSWAREELALVLIANGFTREAEEVQMGETYSTKQYFSGGLSSASIAKPWRHIPVSVLLTYNEDKFDVHS